MRTLHRHARPKARAQQGMQVAQEETNISKGGAEGTATRGPRLDTQ
jgi:hypothetical protein